MIKRYLVKIIIFLFFIINIHTTQVLAIEDFADDDSCIPSITMISRLINNLVSFGFFSVYSSAFNMRDAEGVRCNEPTTNVRFYFTSGLGETKPYEFNVGQGDWWVMPPAAARAVATGDMICVQFKTVMFGYQTIGCKYMPDPATGVQPIQQSCYTGQSCSRNGVLYSKSLLPITAVVLQCIKESLNRVFIDQTTCNTSSETKVNLFPAFQNSMRDIVRAALILYVILFGIKITLSGDIPNKGEFFMFCTKFILVLYFSVGLYTGTDKDGRAEYKDGVTQYIKPSFENATSALAKMVYSAGGSRGLCVYNAEDYQSRYGYLALWDSIDCRLMHYLGFDINKTSGLIQQAYFFQMLLPALISFQLMFALLSILFAIFFLSVVIYFTHVFIIALIALTILIYFAPLFVPFALFTATKGYFDSWLKLMISYALQPMIITGFMALMLTIFDQVMYENCEFKQDRFSVSTEINRREVISYQMVLPAVDQDKCKGSWGWQFSGLKSDMLERVPTLFFDIVMLKTKVGVNLLKGLITLVLFAWLFYNFVKVLSGFAADLTGGNALGNMAVGPTALVDKAKHLATAAIKAKMGDKKGAKEDVKKAAQGDGKSRSGAKVSEGKDGGGTGSKITEGIKNAAGGGKDNK